MICRAFEPSTFEIHAHADGSADAVVASGIVSVSGAMADVFAVGEDAAFAPITRYAIAGAERGIAGASGLDLAKVGPLLSMLAPVVMGALGRARRQGNLGPGQLSEVLAREGTALGGSSGIMGLVAGLLDRDHDGSITDDVGGMLGNLFRRN